MSTRVTLRELGALGLVQLVAPQGADEALTGVRHDSRSVEPGDLFVALPGQTSDGASFAAAAVARGAVAVVAERVIEGLGVPQALVPDARAALPQLAELVYGAPTSALALIGITGTNGKTTCAHCLDEALEALGAKPALLGTVAWKGPGFCAPSKFTTPEADAISRFARRALDARATHLVMEVSSHALAQHRVDALHFEVAAFTNLTRDHLDFHGSMEAYFEAKASLFERFTPKVAVIVVDDPWGARLAQRLSGGASSILRVSRDPASDAELVALTATMDRVGLDARVRTPQGVLHLRSPMLGMHNLDNLMVVAGCLLASGFELSAIERALSAVRGAPGRLERVDDARDVAVLVDYAHTPDALAKALEALRPVTPGRLFALFGCGGDRDPGKRPLMGRAAAERADVVVVTSDNPRTEDAASIVAAIVPAVAEVGLPPITPDTLCDSERGYLAEVDRRAAIQLAIAAARAGDTVLIAGKGHEDYQILGTTKIHFDDREEAAAAIASCGGAR